MRSPLALSCTSGALLLLSARAFSLGGTMLVTDGENFQPGSIIKVDCATGARTTLQSGGNMFGPTFSPDGTKIAFWRAGVSGGPGKIMTMNVDGSGVREVCSTTYPDHRRQAPSWTADGYLYWAEMEPYIYRVSVDTGVKELFYQIDAPVHLPVVSLDSTRLAAMKPLSSYFVFGVDLISGTEMDYGPGCYGSVSPNGELVTHNIDHRTAYIHRFDDGTVYTTVTAPTDTSDASEHRFSRVSNDYIVYSDHRREAYVVNIHTDEKFCHSAGQAWDYYPDTEPEPMLLIRPSALTFEALLGLLSPEPQVVAVTGMGLLSDVTSQVSYEGAGGWLTVVRQGHQNSQTLVNTLTTGTLPVGTYSATVEVACDNASNSPQSYPVTLQVRALTLPFRINAGSNAFDVAGWSRDELFVTDGDEWVSATEIDTAGVENAAHPSVYMSARKNGDHAFTIPVPDGDYTLRLHFADPLNHGGIDIYVEGEPLLEDFYIAQEAGGRYRALVRDFDVTVSGGDGLSYEAVGAGSLYEAGLELFGEIPVNQAPVVDLGADRSVAALTPLYLNAHVEDDGLPAGMLEHAWGECASPSSGHFTFSAPSSEDTFVTFAEAGDYCLRLDVSDGELSGFDEVNVSVTEQVEPRITILQPNGGEAWEEGSVHVIRWQTEALTNVALHYSIDGGATWAVIDFSVDTSEPVWEGYRWLVPGPPSTQCLVRIQGYFGEAPAQSAATFSITASTKDAGAQIDADGLEGGDGTHQGDEAGRDEVLGGGGCTGCSTLPRTAGDQLLLWSAILMAVARRRRSVRRRR